MSIRHPLPVPRDQPVQQALPLEPPPPTEDDPRVTAAIRHIWDISPALHRHYGSLEAAMADPQGGRWMTLCARGAVRARERQQNGQHGRRRP